LFEFLTVRVAYFLIDIGGVFIKKVYEDSVLFGFIGAFAHVAVQVQLDLLCNNLLHFLTIFQVYQSVTEDAQTFMDPYSY